MKDALLVFLSFVCVEQAIHIWRLTKRRDEQDAVLDKVERDLSNIAQLDDEKKRMRNDERKPG